MNSNSLQPPGAGLPAFEQKALGFLLKTGAFFMSHKKLLRIFATETATLNELADFNPLSTLDERVLIDRLRGIEDSSREWSVLMVLDHLCRVNHDIAEVISTLNDDIVPTGETRIADYKPDADVDADIIDRFRNGCSDFDSKIGCLGKLVSKSVYPHPWFGRLTSHQWLALAAVHQRVHRQQAQKIVAELGAV